MAPSPSTSWVLSLLTRTTSTGSPSSSFAGSLKSSRTFVAPETTFSSSESCSFSFVSHCLPFVSAMTLFHHLSTISFFCLGFFIVLSWLMTTISSSSFSSWVFSCSASIVSASLSELLPDPNFSSSIVSPSCCSWVIRYLICKSSTSSSSLLSSSSSSSSDALSFVRNICTWSFIESQSSQWWLDLQFLQSGALHFLPSWVVFTFKHWVQRCFALTSFFLSGTCFLRKASQNSTEPYWILWEHPKGHLFMGACLGEPFVLKILEVAPGFSSRSLWYFFLAWGDFLGLLSAALSCASMYLVVEIYSLIYWL